MTVIASPGHTTSTLDWLMSRAASPIIEPPLASGGWTPRPRKLRLSVSRGGVTTRAHEVTVVLDEAGEAGLSLR